MPALHSRLAWLLLASALGPGCTTVPADREAPTSEEQHLVAAAQAWCAKAGEPAGTPTRPFYTDGCSLWPDGKLYGCCVEHDIAYWCGGSAGARCEADERFRACAQVFDAGQAGLVHLGVRLGGAPWLPLPWRWGYGHVYGSGYAPPAAAPEEANEARGE